MGFFSENLYYARVQIRWVYLENNPNLQTQIIWDKPTLWKQSLSVHTDISERNPLYFQRSLFHLRETHIIWSDNVSLKNTLPERNQIYLQIMWFFFAETYFIWQKPISSDQIMWAFRQTQFYLQITQVFAENPVYLVIVTTACRMFVAITTIIDEYFLELRNMFSNQESIRKFFLKRENSSHGYGCYCRTQSPYVYYMFAVCSLQAHSMLTVCLLHVRCMLTAHILLKQ